LFDNNKKIEDQAAVVTASEEKGNFEGLEGILNDHLRAGVEEVEEVERKEPQFSFYFPPSFTLEW